MIVAATFDPLVSSELGAIGLISSSCVARSIHELKLSVQSEFAPEPASEPTDPQYLCWHGQNIVQCPSQALYLSLTLVEVTMSQRLTWG